MDADEPMQRVEIEVREVDVAKFERGGVYLLACSAQALSSEHLAIAAKTLEQAAGCQVIPLLMKAAPAEALKLFSVPKEEPNGQPKA